MTEFFTEVGLTIFYGFLGLGLMVVFFLIVDRITHFSIKEEISEKKNVAVAVLLAGVAIALALIISSVVN